MAEDEIEIAFEELWAFKDRLRENFLPFTQRAFRMLPRMEKPRILDVGCGSGVPTLELERLSGGEITGIDTDQVQLDRLEKKIQKSGLSGRIKVICRSMLEPDLNEGGFDIVWAEGSIAVMGFERGIREWKRLLRAGGYLIIHDDLSGLEEKMKRIPGAGYELIGHFIIGEEVWWRDYYAPLGNKLDEMRAKNGHDENSDALLNNDRREVDGFLTNAKRYRSVFFVLRKT